MQNRGKYMTVSGLALRMNLSRQRVDQLIREKQIQTKRIPIGKTFIRLISLQKANRMLSKHSAKKVHIAKDFCKDS